jgi:PAS domain S-box-containing protein
MGGRSPIPVSERVYVRRDGSFLIVEVHENRILNGGQIVTGIRSTLFDITPRKLAEAALAETPRN